MRNRQINNFNKEKQRLKDWMLRIPILSIDFKKPVMVQTNSILNNEFNPVLTPVSKINIKVPDFTLDLRSPDGYVYIADMFDGNDFKKLKMAAARRVSRVRMGLD